MNRTHIDIDADGNQTERPYTPEEEADADIRQAEAEAAQK
jgi:hypothetical protein